MATITSQKMTYLTRRLDYIFNMDVTKLEIRENNKEAHIDIGKEILKHKGGWLHFEVRYSGGNIVDLVTRDFVEYKKLIDGNTFVHMVVEGNALDMGYGTASYTVLVGENGEPKIETLKVTKSKRKKYGKGQPNNL